MRSWKRKSTKLRRLRSENMNYYQKPKLNFLSSLIAPDPTVLLCVLSDPPPPSAAPWQGWRGGGQQQQQEVGEQTALGKRESGAV